MVKIFTLAKDPVAPEQNEDAITWEQSRLALADGASSDAFSGLWAQRLCEHFVETGSLDREKVAHSWQAEVQQRPLPWFLTDKLRQPTHASFLGLEWDDQSLQVQAVGDTCVFLIRDNALEFAFPCVHADDFSSQPRLVPTHGLMPEILSSRLSLQQGDLVIAATDAISAWLLSEQERQPWRSLLALQNESDFARWVESLRSTKRLAGDDSTVALVTW